MIKYLIFSILIFRFSIGFTQTHYFPWNDIQINNPLIGSIPAITKSSMALDNINGRIFYVSSNKRICSYHRNINGNWINRYLNYSASIANQETGIILDEEQNLYYISQDGYINRLKFLPAVNQWNHDKINTFVSSSSSYILARPDSRLGVSFPNGYLKIYYIGMDNKIHFVQWTDTGWITAIVNVNSSSARAGSPIVTDDYGKVFYIGIDDRIRCLYFDGYNWNDINLLYNSEQAFSSSDIVIDENGKLYYINLERRVQCIYYSSNTWNETTLDSNSPKVKSTSNFTYNNGNLIYQSDDNWIYSIYLNGCDWITIKLTDEGNNSLLMHSKWESEFYNNRYGNSYYFDSSGFLHAISTNILYNEDYIYIKNKELMLGNSPYFVKGINYVVDLNQDTKVGSSTYNKYYLSRYSKYCNSVVRCTNEPNTAWAQLEADFQTMKNMGFNTVRIVGLGMFSNQENTNDTELYINIFKDKYYPSGFLDCEGNLIYDGIEFPFVPIQVNNQFIDSIYIPQLQKILTIADSKGLKIILNTGLGGGNRLNVYSRYNEIISKIASAFNNNQSLMAIDVYNEPGNEWRNNELTKSDICSITQNMYNSIRNVNNRVLVTINLFPHDVFLWDTEIISADFISFHFYNCANNENCQTSFNAKMHNIQSDFYYVSQYCDKAWIVGETGFSANIQNLSNDHGSIANQDTFIKRTMEYALLSGSSGYTWWDFHDNYAGSPNGSYYGLRYNENDCALPDLEREKPGAAHIKEFEKYCPNFLIGRPSNYYNYYNSSLYYNSGYIYDADVLIPIKNALINCWDVNGFKEFTYTDTNGLYKFYTDIQPAYFNVTAPGYENQWIWNSSLGNIHLNKLDGCSPTIFRIKKQNPIYQDTNNLDAIIFPNPSVGDVSIIVNCSKTNRYKVTLYNNLGIAILKNEFICTEAHSIDLSKHSKGIYYIKIELDGSVLTRKLVLLE